jgi:hypothetical protein
VEPTSLLQGQSVTMAALIKGAKSVTVDKDLSRVLSRCASEAVGADIIVHLLVKVLLIITHPGLN